MNNIFKSIKKLSASLTLKNTENIYDLPEEKQQELLTQYMNAKYKTLSNSNSGQISPEKLHYILYLNRKIKDHVNSIEKNKSD